MKATATLAVLSLALGIPYPSVACTRAVYLGPEETIITVRSMDWGAEIGSNLWEFPRGIKRDGAAGPKSITWTSKYGSVIATAFDAATADGMNEKGLVANLLYLAESSYPAADDARPTICISAWCQYVLDHFATVAEAVAALEKEPFDESVRSPSLFWVNVGDIDFSEGKPVRKLTVSDGAIFSGNTAAKFAATEAFKFLVADKK